MEKLIHTIHATSDGRGLPLGMIQYSMSFIGEFYSKLQSLLANKVVLSSESLLRMSQ